MYCTSDPLCKQYDSVMLSANDHAFDASEAEVRAAVDAADKRIAGLQARAALAGFTCHVAADGFELARWGLVRHARSIEEAEAFVARVGAGVARPGG